MSKPRKREGSPYYWYDFTLKGNRYRGSTQTSNLAEAKNCIAKLRSDILQSNHFGKPKDCYNLDRAFGRYITEYAMHLKSFHKTVNGHIQRLTDFFGPATMLQDIDDNRMAAYVAHRRACRVFDQNEKDKRKSTRAVSNATINREISTFRKMHNLAREVWDVEVGKISFPRHMLKESDCRIRWETPENITKLVDAAADHLKQPIRFALYTGARLSNIMNCKIEDIDFKNRTIRFHVKSSKPGGKFHMVPMVDELYDMITLEMGVDPKARGHLFTYDGQPMKQFRRSWKTACKNAGVEDFRFHDLRHTCASWLIQRGVPIEIVREILGHADIKTTMKYAHHKKEAHREALQMVFAAQSRHNDTKRKRRKAA